MTAGWTFCGCSRCVVESLKPEHSQPPATDDDGGCCVAFDRRTKRTKPFLYLSNCSNGCYVSTAQAPYIRKIDAPSGTIMYYAAHRLARYPCFGMLSGTDIC